MCSDFNAQSHGKWILCGEHAVIRHHPALVFPLRSHRLHFSYQGHLNGCVFTVDGLEVPDAAQKFERLMTLALSKLPHPPPLPAGQYKISSNLPVGMGMGASAALCCVVAQFFVHCGLLEAQQLSPFAHQLEHFFHGQSSGIDIAASLSQVGFVYQKGKIKPLKLRWKPAFYLSFCGKSSDTSDCVSRVNTLWKEAPQRAREIDMQMHYSVDLASAALQQSDSESGFERLNQALNTANECFKAWGLVDNSLQRHIDHLYQMGATAAKPTGSGGGGYVVSLWKQTPPKSMLPSMIAV